MPRTVAIEKPLYAALANDLRRAANAVRLRAGDIVDDGSIRGFVEIACSPARSPREAVRVSRPPVGRRHLVRDGESLETIAARYGHLPDTVWQDAANAELRAKRADPRVLAAGDIVSVPDLRPRVETVATGSRHRYRRKAVPLKLDVALLDAFGEPRADLPFTLVVDGTRVEGMTNADGHAIGWVPIDAKLAELHIEGDVYELALHWLDPVDTPAGLAARLANLGLLDDALADEEDEIALAIRAFQRKHDIEPSGEADDATRAKLVEVHRS